MIGYIKLHRKITQWEWYDDINTTRLFIHLLVSVNYEDKKWRGVEIKRGQILTSFSKLSDETSLSVKQVRRSLDKLKRTSEAASKATTQHQIITMLNYDLYQSDGQAKGQPKDKPRATTKEDKEDKEVKKVSAFKPPTLNDVKNYAEERKKSYEFAKKFFDYYSAGDWKDKDGKKVVSWKQKFITWEATSFEDKDKVAPGQVEGAGYGNFFSMSNSEKESYLNRKKN